MRVEWLAAALDDREAIFRYLLERNPIAALALAEGLLTRADSLADTPDRGRPGLVPGTRELVALRPYILVYEVDHSAAIVRILRVWHSARDR